MILDTNAVSALRPENDLWIAALARQHDQPVVSLDEHLDEMLGLQGWAGEHPPSLISVATACGSGWSGAAAIRG